MRAIILRPASQTELLILCVEMTPEGTITEKGKFTVEVNDSTAILVISRLYLAGATPETIAQAMAIGLLPPKNNK